MVVYYSILSTPLRQECTYPGHQVALVTILRSAYYCGFLERKLLHVTHLAPRVLGWRLDF